MDIRVSGHQIDIGAPTFAGAATGGFDMVHRRGDGTIGRVGPRP
jgi:hypothetical protein